MWCCEECVRCVGVGFKMELEWARFHEQVQCGISWDGTGEMGHRYTRRFGEEERRATAHTQKHMDDVVWTTLDLHWVLALRRARSRSFDTGHY